MWDRQAASRTTTDALGGPDTGGGAVKDAQVWLRLARGYAGRLGGPRTLMGYVTPYVDGGIDGRFFPRVATGICQALHHGINGGRKIAGWVWDQLQVCEGDQQEPE